MKRLLYCSIILLSYGWLQGINAQNSNDDFDLFAESDVPEPAITPMAAPGKIKTYAALVLVKIWLAWRGLNSYALKVNSILERSVYKPVRYFLQCPHEHSCP